MQVLAAISGPKAGGKPSGLMAHGTVRCEVAIAAFCVPGQAPRTTRFSHQCGSLEVRCHANPQPKGYGMESVTFMVVGSNALTWIKFTPPY